MAVGRVLTWTLFSRHQLMAVVMCQDRNEPILPTRFSDRYFTTGLVCLVVAAYFGFDSLLPRGPTTINGEYGEYDPAFPNISAAAAALGFAIASGFCMLASVISQFAPAPSDKSQLVSDNDLSSGDSQEQSIDQK